ncbi:MAG: CopD family protein [Aestuariibacter sp.]
MHGALLLVHILCATIWTGGHIVLSCVVLPAALKNRTPEVLLKFESGYEKLAMPALLLQVLTGIALAYRYMPNAANWVNPNDPISRLITAKLLLLALIAGFAIHARFRVLPNLNQNNLTVMAWHIIPVTLFSILFVVVGVSFRTGWFF